MTRNRINTILLHIYDINLLDSSLYVSMVFSRMLSLLHENPSLLAVEGMTYITLYLVVKHAFVSGKRNVHLLLSMAIQMALVELFIYDTRRWHAAAIVCM